MTTLTPTHPAGTPEVDRTPAPFRVYQVRDLGLWFWSCRHCQASAAMETWTAAWRRLESHCKVWHA